MDAGTLRTAFEKISKKMTENRDYLIELDQQNGDGDLGISMSAGFLAVKTFAEQTEEKDLGRLLMRAGQIFNEEAPSSLGTILSFGLMGMAKSLKGKEQAELQDMAAAIEAGVRKIMEKTGSKPGEKTVLDALCPASELLMQEKDSDPKAVWKKAAEAAAKGSEATRAMRSVHGRAAYYGDQSIGVLDGGSVVGRLIFEALAE